MIKRAINLAIIKDKIIREDEDGHKWYDVPITHLHILETMSKKKCKYYLTSAGECSCLSEKFKYLNGIFCIGKENCPYWKEKRRENDKVIAGQVEFEIK